MNFTWDERKHKISIKKHVISFDAEAEPFDDPFHVSLLGQRFDYFEEWWITIDSTKSGSVIVVGHLHYLTEKGEEVIKIVTARKATKKEKLQYETIG